MGGDGSKNKESSSLVKRRSLSCHQGFLSVPAQLVHHSLFRRSAQHLEYPVSEQSRPSDSNPEGPRLEWTLPGFISVFLPEFPHGFTGRKHLQILGFVAKGSFGPILKVKDVSKDETYAIKVTYSALFSFYCLFQNVLCLLRCIILVQNFCCRCWLGFTQSGGFETWSPPAVQRGGDNSMCDYCSTGDLYTYWTLNGCFDERDVRVFAAELGSALGFLHDFGIIHRDVKMENILLTDKGHLRLTDFGLSRRLERGDRAFTICGTIQYMAPEVLSGGPYSHAADWWSLGVLLYALATGGFPLPPEADHCDMLSSVSECPYDMPATLSPTLAFLLIELLCKIPTRRLRCLELYQNQKFFHGMSFDSQLLQKSPIKPILELKNHPDRPERSMRGLSLDLLQNFECDLLNSPSTSADLSPTLMKIKVNQDTVGAETKAIGTNSP
ncbi:ribosomal protein S6 kinase-related protein isoform X1 [Labeo rohita]|uniref:ribosomal protein S6 kinase-related protein isoform X1 n=1 Tax=Labeo rohita TaxID=84645 RepID=UPI0021E27BB1|nr:ribosomal protein S6 kinase-related protein isoform X1 [Labeo rohita]